MLRRLPSSLCSDPGLVVMLADTDVGSIITGVRVAFNGATSCFRTNRPGPGAVIVQELTVRLGIFTGRGMAN